MNTTPDIEALFEFNGTRKNPAADGYRPHHLIKDDYLTTGVHHYYDVQTVSPCGTAKGTITFITPEAYPNCLWVGKRINIQEGARIVGYATVLKIFNNVLLGRQRDDSTRFNTHDRTPKIKTKKSLKIMFAACFGLISALFLFLAIVCSLYANSIMPAVLILVPVSVIAIFVAITQKDMNRAYVEIFDDAITVIDYCFGIKKEKTFLMQDIASAEILTGSSMRVHGYRCSPFCTYIVFRDNQGKYMFKIICVPETKEFFEKYLKK